MAAVRVSLALLSTSRRRCSVTAGQKKGTSTCIWPRASSFHTTERSLGACAGLWHCAVMCAANVHDAGLCDSCSRPLVIVQDIQAYILLPLRDATPPNRLN